MVKRLPTVQETWVWSLGQEDPLEKEMATHSSTLAWKIPWTEEHNRLQSMGLQRVRHDWATSLHFTYSKSPRLCSVLYLNSYLWCRQNGLFKKDSVVLSRPGVKLFGGSSFLGKMSSRSTAWHAWLSLLALSCLWFSFPGLSFLNTYAAALPE